MDAVDNQNRTRICTPSTLNLHATHRYSASKRSKETSSLCAMTSRTSV